VNCGIDLTYHDDERIADFSGNDPVLAKSLKQLDQEGKLSHFQFYESQDKSLLPRLQSEAVEAWKTYNPAKKKLLFDAFVEKPKLTPSTTVEERRWDYANLKVQSQGLEKKIQETESLLQ
jgi:hypothetical protein